VLVYLGADVVVDAREVVAILEVSRLETAPDGRALVARATADRPGPRAKVLARTLIVTTRGLHLSPLSAETVARRVGRPGETPKRPMAEM
jgi:hypothetical protein